MTADECRDRASACAANAALAPDAAVAQAFLKLAAQWRAMATREIFLGSADALFGPSAAPAWPDETAGLTQDRDAPKIQGPDVRRPC